MANALMTLIYAMLCATAALALNVLGYTSPLIAMLIGATALMFALQIHAGAIRRAEKKVTRREIAKLKQSTREIAVALEETHAKIEEVKTAGEAKASAQGKKIVAELQVLESLMRDFAKRIAENARQETPVVQAAAKPGARVYLESLGEADLLETIRASLEENRVDLYLQPIVSLPQRKLRYYEALSRLRAENGAVIMPAQYMKVAAPAGLMSIVDNLLLFRCVQIVRKLSSRNREVGVFCNISGDTLTDAEFFPQFLEYMHQHRDLAPHIVFEFSQDAILRAGKKGEENLAYLSSLGFALSMDHVETLAIDFARLKSLGFRHIKVRASTLTGNMTGTGAIVAAEDLKALLQRHGVNLIAERVEDEKTVVQLLDYAVDYAQGYLLGEPRAVRDEAIKLPEKPDASVVPFRRSA